MDVNTTTRWIEAVWEAEVLPVLREYITIPNQSPAFDPEWQQHGYMEDAVTLVATWMRAQPISDLALEVVRLPGRTPVIVAEIPGDASETVLLYGHLDKQPPMTGWHEGLGPWTPVLRDGRLYGRGGADDGYAAFAAITAIAALKRQRIPCARCVVLIEACEESGSLDLPHYIAALQSRIGVPSLIVCLDSGCGNYDQLWITTSLRGLVGGNLHVGVLTEGVHSGGASGIVPSSFRVVRQLLDRVEDAETGDVRPSALHVEVPPDRRAQVAAAAAVLGAQLYEAYPFAARTQPLTRDVEELLLNRSWRPQLEVTGAAGLPPLDGAGNVLRAFTTLKLSLRLPPTVEARAAAKTLKQVLEHDPPYNADVRFEAEQGASGWNAPALEPWLAESARRASLSFFGRDACYSGEGGSIPFMGMLGEKFPQAQFMITGVLGPHSNAHGPNEFLDLRTAQRLTACVSQVLKDHFQAKCR